VNYAWITELKILDDLEANNRLPAWKGAATQIRDLEPYPKGLITSGFVACLSLCAFFCSTLTFDFPLLIPPFSCDSGLLERYLWIRPKCFYLMTGKTVVSITVFL
jgi:hypothetical protein